jgi:branched-subunit amino acid ABC-type transport system permease component
VREYLTLIIGGIADGSVVALAALGLVLTYKASGIFNFAQGAIGAVAAGLFYQLYALNHWPAVLSIVITLLVVGLGLGLVMERVANFIAAASTTMKVVATVGLMITLTALFTLKFGGVVQPYPSYLPQSSFSLGGVNISYANLIIILIGIACAAGLSVFFRRTTMGRAMRAVVDDPVLVSLLGFSPSLVRRWAWIIGTTFAAVAGVLIAPSLGLDGTSLTVLVITSFGAVAIGGFASLPLTYAGAIVIQVLVAVATKWASGHQSLQTLPATLPFIILFVVLLVTPKRRLVEVGASLQQRISQLPRPSWKGATLRLAPVVVILVLLPDIVGSYLLDWTIGLVYVILMMSLSLLVRTANQISLCQLSFAAVGAIAAYHLSSLGYPWPVAVLGAGLAAIPVGALVAIAAVRFSGVFLALATLAFGVVLETAVYQTFLMFGGSVLPLPTPRPSFAQSDNAYYYVVLIVVAICYLIVRLIERSRLGQLLRSKADAPQALEALGVSNSVLQTVVFCVGAFLAGIAGALIGPIFGVVGETDFQTIPTSIMLVALLILGARNPRIGTLGAAIGGAIGLVVIPQYITSNTVLSCLDLLFGVAAVEAALASTRAIRPSARKTWFIRGPARLAMDAVPAGLTPVAAASADTVPADSVRADTVRADTGQTDQASRAPISVPSPEERRS